MTADGVTSAAASGVVAALDVGGTGIKAALATRSGVELSRSQRRTPVADGVPAVVDAIVDTILALCDQVDLDRPVRGVGLIFPGVVDASAGIRSILGQHRVA
jgi:glucokinase